MRAFAAALSPELRRLMDSAVATPNAIVNSALQPEEQKWSRQFYYMMSLTTNGEALRRLQNVSEGEGAEAWRTFSEHFEPKTAARYLGMLKEILNFDFGDLDKVIDRIEQFRSKIRKYEEQSGEKVPENVRQAAFQAGVQESVVRDHLALHAGRLVTFDKMVEEVEAVARTRGHSTQPMDIGTLQAEWRGNGKGKKGDGKGKGKGKAKGGGKATAGKGDTNANKDKKCFYCDKVGHVKTECRKKAKDDADRKTGGGQQAGLAAGEAATGAPLATPPGIGGRATSMRMLTVPTYSDEELELPMRLFMLNDTTAPPGHHRVCVDSGAARSACPKSYAADRPTVPSSRQLAFQTASGEILDHYGTKMVPYDLGNFGHLGINYEVTDVNGPVAAVSSMNDSGLTVVFTPNGSWVSNEAPPRPTERVDMVREQRTFWLDVPRSTESQLSHLMPLRQEQAAAPALVGRPADEAAAAELQCRAGGLAGGDQPKDEGVLEARRRPQPKGPTEDERTNHELTHVVFRSWCRHCISTRAKEDPHRRTEAHEGGVPKVMMDWLFFTSDSQPNTMLPALLVYDLTSSAVSALQVGKDCSATTVAAVVQVLDTWGHADVILHMDGEPASKALIRAVAAARGHRTLPRHGPPHSHQSQGPVEATIEVFRGIFTANKLALESAIGKTLPLENILWSWLVRHVGWLITRFNTGADGLTPYRRLFGKPYAGAICRFGEYVHHKRAGRPSSRVEPRWDLGVWLGKQDSTDEHVLGTPSGAHASRSIYRMPADQCFSQEAISRMEGTPLDPRPANAAREQQQRRTYITKRWGRPQRTHTRLPAMRRPR